MQHLASQSVNQSAKQLVNQSSNQSVSLTHPDEMFRTFIYVVIEFYRYAVESLHNYIGSISIALGVVGLLLFLIRVYHEICYDSNAKSSDRTSDKQNRTRRSNISDTVAKDHATLEGLTLLLGKLTEKVEKFEVAVNAIDQKINDRILSHTKIIEDDLTELGQDIDQVKTVLKDKFTKVQRNFNLLGNKIGDFNIDEYHKSLANINEQVREMKNAIFLPFQENDDDSEYVD